MITIHPNPMRLGCQVCRLDADVIAIDIRADGGNDSTIIRMCPKCRAALLAALPPDPAPTGEVARRLAVVEEAVRQAVTDLNFAAATRSIMLVDRAIDDLNAVIHTEQP